MGKLSASHCSHLEGAAAILRSPVGPRRGYFRGPPSSLKTKLFKISFWFQACLIHRITESAELEADWGIPFMLISPSFGTPSHCSSLDSLVLFLSPFQAHLKLCHQAPLFPRLELFPSETGASHQVSVNHMFSTLSHGQMQNFSSDAIPGAMHWPDRSACSYQTSGFLCLWKPLYSGLYSLFICFLRETRESVCKSLMAKYCSESNRNKAVILWLYFNSFLFILRYFNLIPPVIRITISKVALFSAVSRWFLKPSLDDTWGPHSEVNS